jgi:two-component system, chemotaxis family, sensor kinase CheA
MIDSHRQAFIEEASELLAELETTLLELETSPTDTELIARVFRALHTIKGSSAMFGYDDITMFTHDIENVYDFIRKGELKTTKEIIDLTLAARDQILQMLFPESKDSSIDENITRKILEAFRGLVNSHNSIPPETGNKNGNRNKKEKAENGATVKEYLISFKPAQTIFQSGTNPLMLIGEMTELGQTVVSAKFDQIPPLDRIDAEKCYTSWQVLLKTSKEVDAIKDVFIFVEDQCELKITEVDEERKLQRDEDFLDFKKLISDISKNKYPDISSLILDFEPSTTQLVFNQLAKTEIKRSKDNGEIHHENESVSSLRVSAEKLDELVNLVGELVTTQARLSQIANLKNDVEIISVSEEVERITWSLRDSTLNIRMLPIGTTFSKFKRLVRDLSKELGKEVELTTDGAETELDKTVIEKLNDPLIHLIRNCIDHGIETPEVRERAGKSRCGWVQVSAKQSGGHVLIEIHDDGAGMDKEVIRAKAVRTGLINEKDELSDNELYALVFTAGFSTAAKVTNVSGRGVGMDVVKRAIEALRGTVSVHSEKRVGTTITLKLPLTLAIIDGLLVKVEDDYYVLPLSSVEECLELSQEDIDKAHGRHIVNVRGSIVPYISLRKKFGINTKSPKIEQIVVAGIQNNRVGFVVDQVFGQHQTVLKSLGKYYKNIEGVSGATILGDGTVALILDIAKIAEREELDNKISYNS